MHQGHNIPWDLVTSNFEFRENDRRFTPPFSGLVSKNKPNASQELKHFIRKFAQAIRTFSDTERAKYPEVNLHIEGNIFSDELKEKYPEYLNDENQRIEYWIQSAKPRFVYTSEGKLKEDVGIEYGTGNGDLADVVKILLYENEMSTLLMMAHHPKIPIASLHNLSWGHHFGFSRVMESALRAYLFFNAAEATNILASGEYTHSDEYGSLLSEVGWTMDYPAQQVPHQQFLRSCEVYSEGGFTRTQLKEGGNWYDRDWAHDLYVHRDLGLLKGYMKSLFSLLYRYDLLLRECAIEHSWELEIAKRYPINRVIRWLDTLGSW